MLRRTLIVDSALAALEARTRAARERDHGLQVMSVDQAAARLAGGFLQPIPLEALKEAVQGALVDTELGSLASIQAFPGMTRAATTTLIKAWDADLDLTDGHARTAALATLDAAARDRLRPSMRRPGDIVRLALERIAHAPTVLGAVEIRRLADVAPVWRPFLTELARYVPVRWQPGSRPTPDWIGGAGIVLDEPERHAPALAGVSCANPRQEAIEAMRWARWLIAEGTARPQEIAITATMPADWDAHLIAMSRDANIPVHFAHGRPVVSTADGQVCAALAEILLNGLTQDRVRQLVPLLRSQCGRLQGLPDAWTRILPRDAPLTSLELWQRHLARVHKWPQDVNFSEPLLVVLDQAAKGADGAEEAGDALLSGISLSIWKQALAEGPPHALDVTLQGLRVPDAVDPAGAIVWGPAATIAGAPRPYMRLLGLTSRAWPRVLGEDPLLPDHIVPRDKLDPVPVPERDQRDFRALLAGAEHEVMLSRSRRDAEGRQLGVSPLWPSDLEPEYLERSRVAPHVMSEADRLLARPREFAGSELAGSARQCWIDWHTADITPHDGLIRANHPLIVETLSRPQSTGALQKLLRDPLGYVWSEVFRWQEPEEDEEPITLDPLALGTLVHAVFEDVTRRLEQGPGLAYADAAAVATTAAESVRAVAEAWEDRRPVPPRLIWNRLLRRAEAAVAAGFESEFGANGPGPLTGQRSLAEVPFGQAGWRDPPPEGREPPWDIDAPVQITGTGILITGRIDRLDLADGNGAAAVVDYKTGKAPSPKRPPQVKGGQELQRCLYAFAVHELLGGIPVDARLVYPFAGLVFRLEDPDGTLEALTEYLNIARTQMLGGQALPGEGSEDRYNDLRFALPGDAKDRYFREKRSAFNARHGRLVDVWSLT